MNAILDSLFNITAITICDDCLVQYITNCLIRFHVTVMVNNQGSYKVVNTNPSYANQNLESVLLMSCRTTAIYIPTYSFLGS